ncbi:PEP-CTERM sorting domain-containing protein [Aquabacterium sp. A7-Y]|uniref:PEP-CTERM sorting domain-containing protein n=1 Tax=Aquabacterium sp. A7-Y TaxID=1349605 RepID=UPI00223DDCCD|nr:PEP-CTERM sorting domain-containing protein [Aquabacterium sp. A7-Y]MCW7539930.1 PEP-CTERM sorting domain-containing protein [Aquabacterium sp. A7-Y]
MKRHLLALGLALAAGTASAQLAVSSGSEISFTGYEGTPVSFTGVLNSGVRNGLIESALGGDLTVTFLGKDNAGHTNTFEIGDVVVNNKTSAVGGSFTTTVGAGALDFLLTDTTDGDNVGNGGPSSGYASYVLVDVSTLGEASPAYGKFDFILAFNDGATHDADYDDLVVGLSLAPVPEPETYALMLAGLGALGFMARRRKQAE